MISRPACYLRSFYLLICGRFDYRFSHLEISMCVYEFPCVGNRLRIPPYFLLLQNLLASAHYYLHLRACYVYLLLLGRFLLSPPWHSSPLALFLCHWRGMHHILLLLSGRRLPLPALPFLLWG